MLESEIEMTEVYMNLPKRKTRGLEGCWKIKKFQNRRTCINVSAERKRECKSSLLYFLKNIKFLILGIDNIGRLVYYIIKIKGKEINKNDKRRNF